MQNNESMEVDDNSFSTFFAETGTGVHTPRAVFVDLEPTVNFSDFHFTFWQAGDRRDQDRHLPSPLPSWEHDQREGGCCEQLRQVFIWSYKGCNIITLLPTTAPGDITPLARSRYTQPWKRWDRAKNIFRCHKIVQIRRMAGKCSGLQGFLVFHSFGGGNNDD